MGRQIVNVSHKVILSAFCVFGGVVIAALVTVGAWHIQIEPRAFQCWDSIGIFDTYWDDIDLHRGAGDKISPGWTWEEIKTAREVYIWAFFGISIASSAGLYRLISRQSQRPAYTSLEPMEIGSGNSANMGDDPSRRGSAH